MTEMELRLVTAQKAITLWVPFHSIFVVEAINVGCFNETSTL